MREGRGGGPGWRLIVGLLAFALWAPLSLATLPGAALRLSVPAAPATFLRPALQAIVIAAATTAGLVLLVWGSGAWGIFGWEARRGIGLTMRFFVELRPALIVLYEPVVRIVSLATPLTLALKALAGLALAWRWHRWLTTAAVPDAPEHAAIHAELVTTT